MIHHDLINTFDLGNMAITAIFAIYVACLLPMLVIAGPLEDT